VLAVGLLLRRKKEGQDGKKLSSSVFVRRGN